jgi:hypothetical protein
MLVLPFAELLSAQSPIYAILILGGFLLGVYAQAARMPRLLAVAIAIVMFGTLLLIIGAQSADQFDRF